MLCPKCQQDTLAEFGRVEGVLIDFCSNCKGVWFDEGELAFYVETEEDVPDLDAALKAGRPTEYTCPRCAHTLTEIRYLPEETLLVDVCPSCHGIFLDSGELTQVERLSARRGGLERVMATVKSLESRGYVILGGSISS